MKIFMLSILFFLTAMGAMAQGKYPPPHTPEKDLYETYGISLFRGGEGTWFDLRDYESAPGAISYFNILDWLQGRVAGLQVYRYRDIRVPFLRNTPATVYVDEMRVDYSFLNTLPTADIALVKVMPMAAGTAAYTTGGAIAIYTKRGQGEEEEEEG